MAEIFDLSKRCFFFRFCERYDLINVHQARVNIKSANSFENKNPYVECGDFFNIKRQATLEHGTPFY